MQSPPAIRPWTKRDGIAAGAETAHDVPCVDRIGGTRTAVHDTNGNNGYLRLARHVAPGRDGGALRFRLQFRPDEKAFRTGAPGLIEHEVSHAVEHEAVPEPLRRLDDVRMVTDDKLGARLHHFPCQPPLALVRPGFIFAAPVDGHHDTIRFPARLPNG